MDLFRTKRPPAGLRRPESSVVPLAVLLCLTAPGVARANVFGDRFEFGMYGRVGLAWNQRGELVQGRSLNVINRNGIGGRLEEGDYLEPTFKAFLIKPKEKGELDVNMNLTLQMFPRIGSFLQAFASGFPPQALQTEIFQAFITATNFVLPDLEVWLGARQYRGNDIHIADYYYFNDLNGTGGGFKYKGIDAALIIHTVTPAAGTPGDPLYNVDTNLDGTADIQRQRMVFVGQYKYGLGEGENYVQGLGEFHFLPANRIGGGDVLARADYGGVLGAKLHLSLPGGSFNDTSVRYGTGIANGAWGGSRTYETFGEPDRPPLAPGVPDPQANYDWFEAYGLEVVDHVLWNVGRSFALNGYGVLHFNRGSSGASGDERTTWAVGARSFYYVTDRFHLINEATYQERKDGDNPTASVVKLSVVPTLVPTGERGVFVRPHLRLIYTLAIYNEAAEDGQLSPYLQFYGPTQVAHFFGLRTEWWF